MPTTIAINTTIGIKTSIGIKTPIEPNSKRTMARWNAFDFQRAIFVVAAIEFQRWRRWPLLKPSPQLILLTVVRLC